VIPAKLIEFAKNFALRKDTHANFRTKDDQSDDDLIFSDEEEQDESSEHEVS